MENKEKKVHGREQARGAVVGAGVTQAVFAALNVISGARNQDIFSFAVFGLVSLALAVFFVLFKHPAWGILNTILYVIGRIFTVMSILWAYAEYPSPVILVILVLSGLLCVALTAFFIYADYQAFKLQQLTLDVEESE